MNLERVLQINMAILVILGAVLLSLGQSEIGFPLLITFVAVTSVLFTDTLSWFRLNRQVANLVGVVAAFFCLRSFFMNVGLEQMTAIARFLIYLQIVLLYQEKKFRTYWYIAVLSLLQVVIATAMSQSLIFGVLLIIYMVGAIGALVLFFLHREITRSNEFARNQLLAVNVAESAAKKKGADQSTFGDTFIRPPLAFHDYQPQQLLQALVGGRLFRQVASFIFVTAIFTAILFFATTRHRNSDWHQLPYGRIAEVGFSDRIDLSANDNIRENQQLVMRVAFKDTEGKPFIPSREPYFQGAVLTRYSLGHRQTWSKTFSRRFIPLRQSPSKEHLIRQEILLQPSKKMVLFSVSPFYRLDDTPQDVRENWLSQQLSHGEKDQESQQVPYRYVLGTTAFRDGRQVKVIADRPSRIANSRGWDILRERERFPRLLQFGREEQKEFAGLTKVAEQYLAEEGVAAGDHMAIALALEKYFITSEEYSYTLNLSRIQRDHRLDPIEDFVVNHHSGHCELFASALTMMLRSQGIPARMVVGYRGGEYNSVGKYYQVRKRHAHAWVEAYIDSRMAKELLGNQHIDGRGAWLRLDPTPAADGTDFAVDNNSLWKKSGDVFQYAQLLWSEYVMGLNSKQQGEVLYEPLTTHTSKTLQSVFSFHAWKDFLRRTAQMFNFTNWRLEHWFSWRGGLAAIVVCSFLIGCYRLANWWSPLWFRWLGIRQKKTRFRRVLRVEFYERLSALLRKNGIVREKSQTQREFAAAAMGHLNDSMVAHETSNLPRDIVEAFYRVRFGATSLDKEEEDKIEQALSRLEDALAKDRSPS